MFKKIRKKIMAWLTPILDDRKTRIAMWVIPLVSLILQFIISKKFPGKFVAVLVAISLAYWILRSPKK